MYFLLYSFTHYQEPILPILSHLQYLICTSHQSSGTDLRYIFFFFLETGSESTDLHSSLKSSSSKSRVFAFTILRLWPAVRRSTDYLCMCGGMFWCQVSYHIMNWRGQSRGREVEWVQLGRECGERHEHQLLHWLQAGRREDSTWTQTPSRSIVSHLFYNSYPYTIPFGATVIKIGSRSTLTRFLNFQLKL